MSADYVLTPQDVLPLDSKSFNFLKPREKSYLYWLDEVAWTGGLIDLIQLSPEAAGIFLLGQNIFQMQSITELKDVVQMAGIPSADMDSFIAYFASIYGNLGNYLSFGDSKFIPALNRKQFSSIVKLTTAYTDERVKCIFKHVIDAIYSTNRSRLRLAFPPDGITTYYSGNCTREDADLIQNYLRSEKLEGYNTRVFRSLDINEHNVKEYFLAFASAECSTELVANASPDNSFTLTKYYGDYQEIMSLLVEEIDYVKNFCLNETQKQMWEQYQISFRTGSIEAHKAGSKLWVTDKQPTVECYTGFIESYRDPYGVRGEFETFVAIVDKEMSSKFQQLVSGAQSFISLLPWPPTYEKDLFLEPDFTSLDIIAFGVSGLPVGINIPNYDDIRQTIGFKNVSLGNVMKARFQDPTVTFLHEDDKKLYLDNVGQAFEIQVGLHELLGHGSGKLFRRNEDGTFNFHSSVRDLITGSDITHWYEPGETWDSKFLSLASPFEECRAECVGVYLCDVAEVLKLFDSEDKYNPVDVIHINWLSMVRSGLISLEFFSPSENSGDMGAWRQAHCQARFAILKVILECDPPVLTIAKTTGSDLAPDLCINLDRNRLQSVAKPAIGNFLNKLQYYKSTGNVIEGSAFFIDYSTPTPEQLEWRQVVMSRKKPRPNYVQPVTFEEGEEIVIKNYPGTHEGMIQSFADRYSDKRKFGSNALAALESVWLRDQQYFTTIPA